MQRPLKSQVAHRRSNSALTHAHPEFGAINAAEGLEVMLGWAVTFLIRSARRNS